MHEATMINLATVPVHYTYLQYIVDTEYYIEPLSWFSLKPNVINIINTTCLFRTMPESEHYVKRQAGIFEDTYKQDLMSIEREHSYRKQQKGRRGFR